MASTIHDIGFSLANVEVNKGSLFSRVNRIEKVVFSKRNQRLYVDSELPTEVIYHPRAPKTSINIYYIIINEQSHAFHHTLCQALPCDRVEL